MRKQMALVIWLWLDDATGQGGRRPVLRASLQPAGSDEVYYAASLSELNQLLRHYAAGLIDEVPDLLDGGM